MLTHRATGHLVPVDVQAQRVRDSFVAQSVGILAVGLATIAVRVAFTGDVSAIWLYGAGILSFLALVIVGHLVAWYLVTRPSAARTIKRRLLAERLKVLSEGRLAPRQVEHLTHG